jgi:hypothetical protein
LFQTNHGEVNEFLRQDLELRKTFKKFKNIERMNYKNRWWEESGGATDAARITSMMVISMWTRAIKSHDCLLFNEGDVSNIYIEKICDNVHVHRYSSNTGRGDIHDLSYMPSEKYDLVYLPQTLEHSRNPFLAMQNINKIMEKNGFLITSQPFLTRPHMTPVHFFGYTPYGIGYLLQESGFEIIDIQCWGSDEYAKKVIIDRKWPKITQMNDLSTKQNHFSQCTTLSFKKI